MILNNKFKFLNHILNINCYWSIKNQIVSWCPNGYLADQRVILKVIIRISCLKDAISMSSIRNNIFAK